MSGRPTCAADGCSSAAAPGKAFCVFHRARGGSVDLGNESTVPSASGVGAPPPLPPLTAAAATSGGAGATPPPVPAVRVPPPPPPQPQQPQVQAASTSPPMTSSSQPPLLSAMRQPPPPPPGGMAAFTSPPPVPASSFASPPTSTPPSQTYPSSTPPSHAHSLAHAGSSGSVGAGSSSPYSSQSPPSSGTPDYSGSGGGGGSSSVSVEKRKTSFGSRMSSFGASIKSKVESVAHKASSGSGPPAHTHTPHSSINISGPLTSNPALFNAAAPTPPARPGMTSGGGTLRSPPAVPKPSGSSGTSSFVSPSGTTSSNSSGDSIAARPSSSSLSNVSFTRLPSTSRFSLSHAPSGGSNMFAAGGSLDMSTMKELQFHHLSHVPEVLSAQVESGLYAVHRMLACWKRLLAAEEESARAQIRALENEAGKRTGEDLCERTQTAWTGFQRLALDNAYRILDCQSRLSLHCLVPLMEFHQSGVVRHKELDKGILMREREVSALRVQVARELHNCERLMDTWRKLKAEEDGTAAPSESSHVSAASGAHASNKDKAGALFSKLSSKLSSQLNQIQFSNSAGVAEKLAQAAAKYSEVLTGLNRREEIFLSSELPTYLHELQRLEVQRLEVMASAMEQWASLNEERSQLAHAALWASSSDGNHSGGFPRAVAQLDPHQDLDDMLSGIVSTHGPAPSNPGTPWALPVSMDDIRAGRINSNSNSVFHRSLSDLLDAQKATHPSLPVPRFLLYTISAIRSSNDGAGVAAEGIFRISPDKNEMTALKKQLDAVGINAMTRQDIPDNNVFLSSALLKEWMRSLSDSVIPSASYNQCVGIVKAEQAAEAQAAAQAAATAAAAAASDGETGGPASPTSMPKASIAGGARGGASGAVSPSMASALSALVHSLPPVNQRVLGVLSDLVQEVVAESAQQTNRMNYDNLAVVLAPSLLRSQSEDPMELLQNSKYELKFVSQLLKHLGNAPRSMPQLLEGLR